jgi:hypothetical protein
MLPNELAGAPLNGALIPLRGSKSFPGSQLIENAGGTGTDAFQLVIERRFQNGPERAGRIAPIRQSPGCAHPHQGHGTVERFTSDETRAEAARGDAEQIQRRLTALAGMPSLPITPEVANLAAEFLQTGALPATARSDAIHLAVASIVRGDYLLTWNCRHLANAQILRRLEREAKRFGWELPTVCTPLELMGDLPYEIESDP